MDETKFGHRDEYGAYVPEELIGYGPLFNWPPKPVALAKWFFGLPGYILPWNLIITLIGVGVWFLLTPPLEQMKVFAVGWVLHLIIVNYALVLVWYGGWHSWLYIARLQGTRFKYNPRWPAIKNSVFVFHRQNADNVFWTLVSGVPIWTVFQAISYYLYANGYVPFCNPSTNPVWFTVLLFLLPLFGEVHFYIVHRIIHTRLLYKYVHSLHHNNVNPAPWSGLSMHPVEHLLYFSGILIVTLLNSHPIHMLSYAMRVGLTPAIGHTGFDKVELGGEASVDAGIYAHYLHHKLFEVNYADGAIPLDQWFGSFHDGSPGADERLKLRMKKRAEAHAKKTSAA